MSDQTPIRNDIAWFHGKLSREQAYQMLIKAGQQDGLFLVRESLNAPGSFVLSLWSDNSAFHYQIRNRGYGRFNIDEGPLFTGLDTLINYFRDQAGGLATKLVRGVVGRPPPSSICQGLEISKALCRACDVGDENEVKRLLQDPNIDTECINEEGLTSLHVACKKGHIGIAMKLIESKADVNCRDYDGRTPLMYACRGGHLQLCEILVFHNNAAIQDRSYREGHVALHIAAMQGHIDCVQLLLRAGAPAHPRSIRGNTPKDFAKDNGYNNLAKYLETFVPPTPKANLKHWLHENVDREVAVSLLYKWRCTDGLFLIRTSTRDWGVYVLTMADRNSPYHFQIQNKGDRWFYIDDGPLFETLPHLVDYYGALADGLPHKLTYAIQPSGNQLIPIQCNPLPLKIPLPIPSIRTQSPIVKPKKPSNIDCIDRPKTPEERFPHQTNLGGRRPPPPLPPLPGEEEDEKKPQTIINVNDVQAGAELGQGEFGSVLRGIWRNPGGKVMDVALKTLHPDKIMQGEQEFLREARVMSGLNHPCVVKLLGVCLGPPLILVQELVSMGALLDYLYTLAEEICLGDLKLWAAQIAWGMMYLEEKRFVHRDLATRNILLQSRNQIKISDFGLSRAIGSGSNYYVASKGGRWPVKWYAPESINYGRFSHESDVWSYGVTLWEMFSFGEQPYGEMSGAEVMELVEIQGKRLERPEKCPEHTYQLMLKCWDLQPEKRPTFAKLHEIFKTNPLYSDVEINT